MRAYIALEKYIVKEFRDFGVGVPVAFDESTAREESHRRKNVAALNQWLEIEIPEKTTMLDMSRPVSMQDSAVIECLKREDFLLTLFISEARKLFDKMDSKLYEKDDKKEKSKAVFGEFEAEKFAFLEKIQSGFELMNFINSKCKNHDMAISSALLYSAGITGNVYKDKTGERALLFNAAKDIEVVRNFQGDKSI